MSKQLYSMDPDFEAMVVHLLAVDPAFWDAFGEHLDPECFSEGNAKTAIEACIAISKSKVGLRPGGVQVVGAHLTQVGKHTLEVISQVKAYLLAGGALITAGALDSAREIFGQAVRRQVEVEALRGLTQAFVNKEELSGQAIDQAQSIGRIVGVEAEDLNDLSAFDSLANEQPEHLETGINDLDERVRGLPVGTVGLWIADTGGGKSMALSQVAANAWLWGLNVCYATLELQLAPTKLRLYSAALREQSGVLSNQIKSGDAGVRQRLAAANRGGRLNVAYFPPGTTTPNALFKWVKSLENKGEFKNDLLVIDYADRLGVEGSKVRRGDGDYHASRIIYEEFQAYTKNEATRIWTASQARRGAGKKDKAAQRSSGRLIDLQDVADSKHKVNASDLVITITPLETYDESGDLEASEEKQLTLLVAKYRHGSGRAVVGPLPAGFTSGRLVDTGRSMPVRFTSPW